MKNSILILIALIFSGIAHAAENGSGGGGFVFEPVSFQFSAGSGNNDFLTELNANRKVEFENSNLENTISFSKASMDLAFGDIDLANLIIKTHSLEITLFFSDVYVQRVGLKSNQSPLHLSLMASSLSTYAGLTELEATELVLYDTEEASQLLYETLISL